MAKQYWLVKSEPSDYSFAQFKKDGRIGWTGVRNYQARNTMRDSMKLGDGVLFYHSSTEPTAVVGSAEVSRESYPDPAQFDKKSDYYDAKSKPDAPTWMMVEIKFVEEFAKPVTLAQIKSTKGLEKMRLVQKGSRLSVQPVSAEEWAIICKLGR